MNSDILWVEKYRPRNLKDLVLDAAHKTAIEGFLKDGAIPHILLTGMVGSGKTTIARILAEGIDCSVLELNASDERGIDTVRDKVKRFLMVAGLKKWRVVFLDEADYLTPDAQAALRNVFERFSDTGRFILTANHQERIIEAIRSRCQVFQFKALDRKRVYKLCTKILAAEEVKFDPEDVLRVLEDHHPDVRSVVNALQLGSNDGEFNYEGLVDIVNDIRERLKMKDVNSVRKLVMTHRPDFTLLYRGLFDSLPKFVRGQQAQAAVAVTLVEGLRWDAIVADREMNFAGCCHEIVKEL